MNRFFMPFCLLVIAGFLSCSKELSYIGGPDNFINVVLPKPITATLQGNIVDENGAPAAGVAIAVGGKTASTDAKGFFRIAEAPLDENTALVTAQKPGYFKALRTFCATSGTNQVNIKLIKKTLAGTINSNSGGEVALSNGSKIKLPANGVVIASSNAAYTGDVKVYAAYIDPTAADIDRAIPGSFMAENKNGSRVTLESYGMLAVELEGNPGEKLQIKTGNTATLTTAIPSSVQSGAPSSIALWSVNETTGLWKEEGTATKNGSVYVGEVSHFSFWNCDIGIPAIKITVKLQDNKGLPIIHATVKIMSTANGISYGITDSLGVVSGLVPSNQQLKMEVVTACNTSIFTQNIGPFSQNTTLNPITLSGTDFLNSYLTIKGKLVNCANTAITKGYVIISYGNNSRWVKADASGNISTTLIHCPGININSIQVLGVDEVGQQQGTATTIPLSLPVTDIGTISACGTATAQFVTYTLDGSTYTINPTSVDSSGAATFQTGTEYRTSMNAFDGGKYFSASFTHATTGVGTYPINGSISISATFVTYSAQGNTGVNVTFTKFAQTLGDFYEGSFSGTFTQGVTPHTITNGSFKLRRNN